MLLTALAKEEKEINTQLIRHMEKMVAAEGIAPPGQRGRTNSPSATLQHQ